MNVVLCAQLCVIKLQIHLVTMYLGEKTRPNLHVLLAWCVSALKIYISYLRLAPIGTSVQI